MAKVDTTTEKVEKVETVKSDAEKMVTIRLPLTREKQADVFVGINGQTWLLKRGEEIEVPEAVAEVLRNSEAMDALALERSQALSN